MLIGVVGKPSVGKSTFFKALTLANVAIAAYPFTTIEPNKAMAFVRVQCVDKEFGVRCNPRFGYCASGVRFVPVELLDVAGLVPGAHEGKGMGNQFLDDLRQADALLHVVDIAGATNEKGESVPPGSYDPAFDVKFLEFEIDMWFLSVIKKGWDKLARQMQQEKQDPAKVLGKQLSGLNVSEELVQKALADAKVDPQQPAYWQEESLHHIARFLRKATKPMVVVANKIDLPHGMENFERLKKEFPDYTFIPASSESELALREASKAGLIDYVPGNSTFAIKGQLSEKQARALEFIKKNILESCGSTGVQQALDAAVFDLLRFIAVFPGGVTKLADQHGNVLPDCFLVKPLSTALDFAYKLHTDLGKHFIRAIDVRSKRSVGRDHLLKHRDVIEIVSGK